MNADEVPTSKVRSPGAESGGRCSRCILPATTPGIRFDAQGTCSYCHRHSSPKVLGEDAFLSKVAAHRDPCKRYDCMIGVSGGRDSTFLMWKLAHDYGLRVLAAHYANPFTSAQATRNLDSAAGQLGVDLIKWTYPDEHLHERETRKALKVWSKRPSHAMLPIVCAVCKGWWPTFIRIARENDISLIVIGSNPLETASFKEASFGGARTYLRLSRLPKTALKALGEVASNPGYLRCSWTAVAKGFLTASHTSPVVRRLAKGIEIVRLFDYIEWSEDTVMKTIQENLGWQQDPDHASPWRFDCRLDHVKKFLYRQTIGVSELEDLFSKMVRENIITREQALERLKTENVTPLWLVEQVLAQIGLKVEDLQWPSEWAMDVAESDRNGSTYRR